MSLREAARTARRPAEWRLLAWLEREGYCVLRFWNNDVLGNIEGVLKVIARALDPALDL